MPDTMRGMELATPPHNAMAEYSVSKACGLCLAWKNIQPQRKNEDICNMNLPQLYEMITFSIN